jgi:hypothetical protein
MLSPTVNEFLQRVLYLNPKTQLFVFRPKSDALFADVGDATLGNGRPSQVATVVSQAMVFRLGGLNFDAPPASLQMNEHVFHLVDGQVCAEPTGSPGCAEQLKHSAPPKPHQLIAVVVEARLPGAGGSVQTSRHDHRVDVGIEL